MTPDPKPSGESRTPISDGAAVFCDLMKEGMTGSYADMVPLETARTLERELIVVTEMVYNRSEEIEALERALTEAKGEVEVAQKARWQPIETYRKPEVLGRIVWQRILAYHSDWRTPVILKWSPGRPAPHWTTDAGEVVNVAPSHWMPLPPNP